MDERELRAFHQAAQPILQRTAPVGPEGAVKITPPILDQIAWNVVLAFVANASPKPPKAIPRQAQTGESLRDEQIYAALASLKRASGPPLEPQPQGMAQFEVAVRRILGAYGWAPRRAGQAASEVAAALQAVTARR